MATVLKVPDSLPAMAARWQTQAAALPGTSPAENIFSCQPSAAAMGAVLAGTGTALTRLSGRMRTTATKFSLADIGFDDNESAAAANLRAVAERVM